MASGPTNKFRILANAGSVAAAALVAACATPTSQLPKVNDSAIRAASDKQRADAAAKVQVPITESKFLNFPMEQRLGAVVRPIFFANADFCGANVITSYPVSIGNPGGNGAPVIMTPVAGLEFGDRILSVNGKPVAPSVAGTPQFLNEKAAAARRQQMLSITAQRGIQVVSAAIPPATACSYPVTLVDNGKFNAYATGVPIRMPNGQTMPAGLYVEKTLMNTLKDDSMLAAVTGHELAHIVKGHSQAKEANGKIGMGVGGGVGLAVDILAGIAGINTGGAGTRLGAGLGASFGVGAYSQQYELEADYFGTYMMARAGYDPEASVRVAEFLASKSPQAIDRNSTHPGTAEREATNEATANEIRAKRATGKPLTPN